MLKPKTLRTYDRFGSKDTTIKWYHKDDETINSDGTAYNGNGLAVCLSLTILFLLFVLGVFW